MKLDMWLQQEAREAANGGFCSLIFEAASMCKQRHGQSTCIQSVSVRDWLAHWRLQTLQTKAFSSVAVMQNEKKQHHS